MRLIYYWNILLLVILCACGAEVGEHDNPFDGGADMTDYERDVSGWSKGSEGEAKHGNISKSCYVYENKFWRLGNDYDCSLGFGGCIAALQDSLRKGDFWYKCDTLMWRRASAIETDTAGWGAVKDGEVRAGRVNDSIYYIYEKNKKAWREAILLEYDTYDYTNNKDWATGKDGDCEVGSVNANNCYVFEDKVWRIGNRSDCSLNLRGCTSLRQGTVGKGSDKVWRICDSKSWRNATTYEKDTFGWKNSTDGAIKKGNVTDTIYVFDKTAWRIATNVEANLGGCVAAIADSVGKVGLIYYICKSSSWTTATTIEYDTYRWAAGKDGDSKLGSVNANNCYVYENTTWRSGNMSDCSLGLRGCTALRQDAVGRVSDKVWLICDNRSWRNATTYEKDTFGWKDSTDGAIKKGNVTDTIYVFDKTSWRATSAVEGKLGGCVSAIADSIGKVGSVYYICKYSSWATATAIEYDTYRWAAGKDGDSKLGSVNANSCYVYENKAWRSGNTSDCSLGLRGCTSLRQDTVGKGSDKVWHICDATIWRDATTYEKDTFGWKNGTDGEIKKGNVTDSIYVFDKTAWRATTNVEAKLGGCVSAIADSIGKVGSVYYICKSRNWVEASAIEYDTYRWAAGKDGDSKVGSVNANNCYVYENETWRSGDVGDCSLGLRGCIALRQDTVGKGSDKVWYICDSKSWRNATTFEKDTFGWKKGTDGEIKKGNVTDSIYVFDKTAWRATTNVEAKLGGCVAAIADSVGKVGSTYYICTPREWKTATVLQYDTYKKECLTDGSIVDGNVISSNKYVCDDGLFRFASENDLRAELGCTSYTRGEYRILSGQYSYYKCETDGWTFTIEKLNQGTMTDERDGHVYKTIGADSQMWLAENLNYKSEFGSFCYNNDENNCSTYGKLYTYDAALISCPSGWHLPNYSEWMHLLYDWPPKDGRIHGWKEDKIGLSFLPAGIKDNENFVDIGEWADFWVLSEGEGRTTVDYVNMYGGGWDIPNYTLKMYKNYALSVRCIKDE